LCGRYTLLRDEMKIRQRFDIDKEIADYEPSYNIAPGQNVLAVIHDGNDRRAGYLRWGLVPFWAKDERIGYKMINARSETIDEKASFKHLLMRKRCLIIADSFYEWRKTDAGKTPIRFQLPNEGLFAFAGLWDKWQNGRDALFTCTILTKESNAFMKPIHHRMPIILPKNKEAEWISSPFQDRHAVKSFVETLDMEELMAYPVSDYVNNAKHNDARCIEPTTTDS